MSKENLSTLLGTQQVNEFPNAGKIFQCIPSSDTTTFTTLSLSDMCVFESCFQEGVNILVSTIK